MADCKCIPNGNRYPPDIMFLDLSMIPDVVLVPVNDLFGHIFDLYVMGGAQD